MRLLLVSLLVLAGCSAPPTPTPAASTEPSPGTTEPCRSDQEVIATLDRFVAAFNSGDQAAIRRNVSRYAEWFSVSAVPLWHQSVYGQDDVVVHLLKRQAAGDRLADPKIEISGLVGWDGSAHFGVRSLRLSTNGSVTDLIGKGALQCRGRGEGIVVLGLAKAIP